MSKMNGYKIITAGLVGLTTCVGLVLGTAGSYADDNHTDTANITVPESCSMTGTINTAHNATLNPGTWSGDSGSQFENGIGKTTLTTFCNDNNGFSVYAVGYTGDTEGTNTLVGTNTNLTINTGVYSTGDTTSSWAMKVDKVENPQQGDPITWNPQNMTIQEDTEGYFNTWHTVPDDYTKIAEYKASTAGTSSTTDTALGAKLETTYAAYISQTQAADTYTGKVKYVMVHPYDAAAPIVPLACNPNGTTISTIVCMQDINATNKSSILTSMTEDQQYVLADSRDEKRYTVAKLKDGNIWMTQNLDHDIVTTQNYYTNENTDIGWNSNTNSYDTATWTSERATYPTGTTFWNDYHATNNPTGLNGSIHPESYDPGDSYISQDAVVAWRYSTSCDSDVCDAAIYQELSDDWKAYYDTCYVDDDDLVDCDESLKPIAYTTNEGIQQYHLGNYYNWTAAVAMNDSNTYSSINTDANQSICPSGWMLPKAGINRSNGSARYLMSQYGWNEDTYRFANGVLPDESPLYMNKAGRWSGSSKDLSSFGGFWSSMVQGSNISYGYYVSANSAASPSSSIYRGDGYSVRCLAR